MSQILNNSNLSELPIFKSNKDLLTAEVKRKCSKNSIEELLSLPIFGYNKVTGSCNTNLLTSEVLIEGNKKTIEMLLEMPIFNYNRKTHQANTLLTANLIAHANIDNILAIIVLFYNIGCLEYLYYDSDILLMNHKDLEKRVLIMLECDIPIAGENSLNPLLLINEEEFLEYLQHHNKSYIKVKRG